ncbi:unnamed protein product [Dibothriocephalus latus]|uniref:Uncharacterized protein n=1 Tax=Dibothriocephalus latus TaxID=60516 RepID=A0A3P6U4D3_DIBLA|nr:unnamed protein product [Dibothriocephalus latus]
MSRSKLRKGTSIFLRYLPELASKACKHKCFLFSSADMIEYFGVNLNSVLLDIRFIVEEEQMDYLLLCPPKCSIQ